MGAVDPHAIMAAAQFTTAATGAGLQIASAVRSRRKRKRRRKKKRRAPIAPPPVEMPMDVGPPPEGPPWPLILGIGAIAIVGFLVMKQRKASGGKG